jgi:tetratricopeptide (TPR) repeat protein
MAYGNRGAIYQTRGQHDRAISDYTKAIEANPNDVVAYSNRGTVYFAEGKYDKASEDFKKAQALGYRVPPEYLKRLREASGREK